MEVDADVELLQKLLNTENGVLGDIRDLLNSFTKQEIESLLQAYDCIPTFDEGASEEKYFGYLHDTTYLGLHEVQLLNGLPKTVWNLYKEKKRFF